MKHEFTFKVVHYDNGETYYHRIDKQDDTVLLDTGTCFLPETHINVIRKIFMQLPLFVTALCKRSDDVQE